MNGAQVEALDQNAPQQDAHDGHRDGQAAYEQVGIGCCDGKLVLQELGQEGGYACHHGRHAHLGQDHQQEDGVLQGPQQHPRKDCWGEWEKVRVGRPAIPFVSVPSCPVQDPISFHLILFHSVLSHDI